ncbi:Uncharacterized protein OBRU01_12693 [Operophtera brumata]|uniref:Uncharacterized protein n=1 Tax=Operophtera brumata TaxID=104452 RepID=A0A0L7L9X1_OPEBR|nr:Uncharacterized protein OBRU01_12693 [Operophtera brumata]
MSRDHSKQRRHDHHSLKSLPSEVLLKARSTLVSLGGALKHKNDHHEKGKSKQEKLQEKKNNERLKNSRSEPEFSEIRKKHRSRLEESTREYGAGAVRQRPMSVGTKHYDKDLENYRCGSFPRDTSPLQRRADSTEEVCVQSRLYIPVAERLNNQDVQMQDVNEKPRKKLSFREPEIIISNDHGGSATLGRSNKHMGVNSLSRRPNRTSLRNEEFGSSLEGLELDLEVST